jgi:hypothetical protein
MQRMRVIRIDSVMRAARTRCRVASPGASLQRRVGALARDAPTRESGQGELQRMTQEIRMGYPMAHKFKVGETVTMSPATSRNVPGGVYEVTKQLRTMAASTNIESKA